MNDATVQPSGQKKRGRPRKHPLPSGGNEGELKPKKARPECETSELAKYHNPEKWVAWGVQPECKRFKRKGIAALYNPEHKGGMVTLMPVTDDGGAMRWRYRGVPGSCPFRYEKFDLEPGQAATLPSILRKLADTIEGIVVEHFGDIHGADQTTIDYLKGKKDDLLGEKIKKFGLFT